MCTIYNYKFDAALYFRKQFENESYYLMKVEEKELTKHLPKKINIFGAFLCIQEDEYTKKKISKVY